MKILIIFAVLAALARSNPVVTVTLDPKSHDGDYFGALSITGITQPDYTPGIDASFDVPGLPEDVFLALRSVNATPGSCYFYGQVGLTSFAPVIGGGGTSFQQGVPLSFTPKSNGDASMDEIYFWGLDHVTSLELTSQFLLWMPWNGSQSDWSGTWEVKWTMTDHYFGGSPAPQIFAPVAQVSDESRVGLLLLISGLSLWLVKKYEYAL